MILLLFQPGLYKDFIVFGVEHCNNTESKTKVDVIEGAFGTENLKLKFTSAYGQPIDSDIYFFGDFLYD